MTATELRPSLDDLRRTSIEARKLIVEAIHHAGAGHLGGPLSAADILVALYFDQMNVDPSNPDWPERDRFILSKGHSSIALYTVLAMRGYFPVAELDFIRYVCMVDGRRAAAELGFRTRFGLRDTIHAVDDPL